jgi:hypothetical protein
VTVAGDDLGGGGLGHEAEPLAGDPLHLGIAAAIGAHCAGELADAHACERRLEAVAGAVELERPTDELRPEGDGLRVNSVRPADHDSLAVLVGAPHDGCEGFLDALEQKHRGFSQLQRERSVEDVGGRQAVVQPAPLLAQVSGHRVHECGDVVLSPLLDLRHALRGRRHRSVADRLDGSPRNRPDLGPALQGCELHLEPASQAALVRPDSLHGRTGVALDHRPDSRVPIGLAPPARGESNLVRALALLLGAAALAATVGCSAGGPEGGRSTRSPTATAAAASTSSSDPTTTATQTGGETQGTPTADELRWTGRLARWTSRLGEAFISLGRKSGEARPDEGALRSLHRCTRALEAVGAPPNESLVETQETAEEICDVLDAVAPLLPAALEDPDSKTASDVEDEVYRVGGLIVTIHDGVQPFMPGAGRSLPAAGASSDRSGSRIDLGLGRAATIVADAEVEVRCWSRSDWRTVKREAEIYSGKPFGAGVVGFVVDAGVVNLRPYICFDLAKLRWGACGKLFCDEDYRPEQLKPRMRLAAAVVTLAHEVQHAVGVSDEAAAECFGMQRAAFAARTLDVERAYAKALARDYYYFVYPNLPRVYHSSACRPGGKLDLNPKRPDWP